MAAPFRQACVRKLGYNNSSFLCQSCSQSLRVLFATNRNHSEKNQTDFFGIHEDDRLKNEAESVGGTETSSNSEREAAVQKLLRSLQKKQRNKEIVVQTVFGQVRLDSQATKSSFSGLQPGQFQFAQAISVGGSESNSETAIVKQHKMSNPARKSGRRSKTKKGGRDHQKASDGYSEHQKDSSNYIDSQYFAMSSNSETHHTSTSSSPSQSHQSVGVVQEETNYIEAQYFSEPSSDAVTISKDAGPKDLSNYIEDQYFSEPSAEKKSDSHHSVTISKDAGPKVSSNYIEDQYFSEPSSDSVTQTVYKDTDPEESSNYIDMQYFGSSISDSQTQSAPREVASKQYTGSMMDLCQQYTELQHRDDKAATSKRGTNRDSVPFAQDRVDLQSNMSTKPKVPNSAYDAAMETRRQLKLKSKEKSPNKDRVLAFQAQVPDLHQMPSRDVAKLLANNILYENDDFIAVSKPYGLPSHGGPGVQVSVGQVLEPLCTYIDKGRQQLNSLHLVHRLDKETTGVMLLAKNAEVAWQLHGMFRRREVGKIYWTITKGLPQPAEGVVEIPLARLRIHGIYKTVVKPKEFLSGGKVNTDTWNRRGDKSMAAVTEYRVLAHRDSMALVECRPQTGVQHQIRAHLAQALNAPVLGDHKYSHMDRLAPQKLFPEALQKLGIRQAQVRHVPMHLHAKGLLLPEWRGMTNIFIKAGIPRFFLQNLKTLKIKIPRQ